MGENHQHYLAMLLVTLTICFQKTSAYTAFNCEVGPVEEMGHIVNYTLESPTLASAIRERGVAKVYRAGYTGEVMALKYPKVYKKTCTPVEVTHIRSDECFDRFTTKAENGKGETLFVDDSFFVTENPARVTCPVESGIEGEITAQILTHLGKEQTLAEINEARTKNGNYLVRDRKAMLELAEALEEARLTEEDGIIGTITGFYKTYIAQALMFYSIGYVVYTLILLAIAIKLGISWKENLRLVFPFLRRLHDLLAFRTQKKKMREMDAMQQLRQEAGLEEIQLPIDTYTNRHLIRVYTALEEIHQRMDSAGIPEVIEEDSGATTPATTPGTLGDSTQSSPASTHVTRREIAEPRRRNDQERRVVYFRNI